MVQKYSNDSSWDIYTLLWKRTNGWEIGILFLDWERRQRESVRRKKSKKCKRGYSIDTQHSFILNLIHTHTPWKKFMGNPSGRRRKFNQIVKDFSSSLPHHKQTPIQWFQKNKFFPIEINFLLYRFHLNFQI